MDYFLKKQPIYLCIIPHKVDELSHETTQILNLFFSSDSQLNNRLWMNGTEFPFKHNHIDYLITFSHSMIKVKRKKNENDYKLLVFNSNAEALGKGGYGIVYPITGAILLNSRLMFYKSLNSKVVKVETRDLTSRTRGSDPREPVIKEYTYLEKAQHLHVKSPVFSEKSNVSKSYLIMDYVKGYTLEQILNPYERKKIEIPSLNTSLRLELTCSILTAIKTQVLDKKIIHRDIKPSNIMVNFEQSPPQINIIDYGLAMHEGMQDHHRVGTKGYKSSEAFKINPIYTSKSDVYSAGRVLSYLWGDHFQNYYFDKSSTYESIKSKSTNEQLFSDNDIALYREDSIAIKNTLNNMIAEQAEARMSIEEAIHFFSSINKEKYNYPDLSQTKISRFETQLKQLIHKINDLKNKEHELESRGYFQVAAEMRTLRITLIDETNQFYTNPYLHLLSDYKKKCITTINESQNSFKNHRNSRWIIAEIATAISLLGVGYFVALGFYYLTTGRIGLFSQTKSEALVEDLSSTLIRL